VQFAFTVPGSVVWPTTAHGALAAAVESFDVYLFATQSHGWTVDGIAAEPDHHPLIARVRELCQASRTPLAGLSVTQQLQLSSALGASAAAEAAAVLAWRALCSSAPADLEDTLAERLPAAQAAALWYGGARLAWHGRSYALTVHEKLRVAVGDYSQIAIIPGEVWPVALQEGLALPSSDGRTRLCLESQPSDEAYYGISRVGLKALSAM